MPQQSGAGLSLGFKVLSEIIPSPHPSQNEQSNQKKKKEVFIYFTSFFLGGGTFWEFCTLKVNRKIVQTQINT